MSGGFRKDSDHEMHCSVLTVIETLERRKIVTWGSCRASVLI